MFSVELGDWEGVPASRSFSEEDAEESWIGRPKPFAKEAGFAKPARPKRVISAVPIRIARHSAGGGRLAKRLRVWVDMMGDFWWCCSGGDGDGGEVDRLFLRRCIQLMFTLPIAQDGRSCYRETSSVSDFGTTFMGMRSSHCPNSNPT